MSRKMYALLLPVLAIAAMAMTAGAAQAAPHWYLCEKLTTETGKFTDPDCEKAGKGFYELKRLPFESGGKVTKVQVITFGRLSLTIGTTTITCKVSDAGNIWNTVLANPGLDEIVLFVNYECTISSESVCKKGLELTASGLPWLTELNEVEEGGKKVLRDRIKGIKVTFKCAEPVVNEVFEGELNPKFVNNSPSFAEFDTASGHLTSAHLGNATVSGKDFVEGFEHGEAVQVFNP